MIPSPESEAENNDEPVLRFRTIFISDVHLGTRACQAASLLDFLRHTESEFLYLVGDIVDGWHLRRRWYWPQSHNDIVQKIMQCARRGTKVWYLPGNHDEAARPLCGMTLGGMKVIDQIVHEAADGRRILILHGDQFDAVMGYAKWLAHLGDRAYDVALLANKILNVVRRWLGFPYWSLSAYLKHKVKNTVEHISAFETFIVDNAKVRQADSVLCGHIHHAEMRQVGKILYMNDGDWIESCTALVEAQDGKLSILNWVTDRARLLAPT